MRVIQLISCIVITMFCIGCTNSDTASILEPCDKCKLVPKPQLRTILHPLIYEKGSISTSEMNEYAQEQVLRFSDELRKGYKFNACGCVNGNVHYQIYTATAKTYELVAILAEDNSSFWVEAFFESEFEHP